MFPGGRSKGKPATGWKSVKATLRETKSLNVAFTDIRGYLSLGPRIDTSQSCSILSEFGGWLLSA